MDFDVTSLHHRRASRRWDRTAVGDMVERMTWSFPDRSAFVGAEGAFADPAFARVTYREADEITNRIAHALVARGLVQGNVVALLCENSVEAFLVKLGVAKAGLTVAPLNPSLAPAVATGILGRIEPALVVVDAEVWPRLGDAVQAAGLAAGVTIEIGGSAVPGSVSFTDLIAGQPSEEVDVEIHGDDIWELLFTSGTTATPKAVMLSHSTGTIGAYGFALSLTRGLRIEDELILCSFLPLIYHVGDTPFALGTLAAGGTLVLGRKPQPLHIARTVEAERATALWSGSPQLLRGMAEALESEPDIDVTSLGVIVYGWAELHPDTLAALERRCAPGLVVFEIFGQTEAIACHRFWPLRWEETYQRTAPMQNYVGVPSPLLASTVMDPDGRSLRGSPGEPGEAVYRSPVMMAGYYKDEAATREAFRYGWFHSGDSCVFDPDDLRVMVDRYKDIIKSGGENVSSLRVESVLVQHAAVARAAVVGLPHDHWGEAVTAVIVAREGSAPVDADEVIAFCRKALAGFETPKQVVVVDDLPETVGGKVLKYRLRATLKDLYRSKDPQP